MPAETEPDYAINEVVWANLGHSYSWWTVEYHGREGPTQAGWKKARKRAEKWVREGKLKAEDVVWPKWDEVLLQTQADNSLNKEEPMTKSQVEAMLRPEKPSYRTVEHPVVYPPLLTFKDINKMIKGKGKGKGKSNAKAKRGRKKVLMESSNNSSASASVSASVSASSDRRTSSRKRKMTEFFGKKEEEEEEAKDKENSGKEDHDANDANQVKLDTSKVKSETETEEENEDMRLRLSTSEEDENVESKGSLFNIGVSNRGFNPFLLQSLRSVRTWPK